MVDLYWGVDPEEWDGPELQRLRMKLLEECLKTSAGPCFVVSVPPPPFPREVVNSSASRLSGGMLSCTHKRPERLKKKNKIRKNMRLTETPD